MIFGGFDVRNDAAECLLGELLRGRGAYLVKISLPVYTPKISSVTMLTSGKERWQLCRKFHAAKNKISMPVSLAPFDIGNAAITQEN